MTRGVGVMMNSHKLKTLNTIKMIKIIMNKAILVHKQQIDSMNISNMYS